MFVRCRVWQMELTKSQIQAIVCVPKSYLAAYRASYRLGKKLAAEEENHGSESPAWSSGSWPATGRRWW
jgi:hypothetical protein